MFDKIRQLYGDSSPENVSIFLRFSNFLTFARALKSLKTFKDCASFSSLFLTDFSWRRHGLNIITPRLHVIDQPISSNRQHVYITRDSQAKLSFSPGRDHPASCIAALPYFVPETREDLLLVVFLSKGCCNICINNGSPGAD